MKRFRGNKELLDKEKFIWLEREKRRWLKNLSTEKVLRLEESLLSSSLVWEWRKNFAKDNPICLKDCKLS